MAAVVMPVDVVMPAPVVRISRLALATADAVMCLWIASLWVFLASVAAALIGLLACGSGCPVVGAACAAVLLSVLFVVILCPVAAMLLIEFVEPFYIDQLQKGAAVLEPINEAVIMAHFVAITGFGFLEVIGFLLQLLAFATKDPPTEKIACVIMVVPPLAISAMGCFVSIPVLAVRVWRMRRHGRASVVPI